MIIKSDWQYEEFPPFTDEVEGAVRLRTSGEEIGVRYLHNVEYDRPDDHPLHLQILYPATRRERSSGTKDIRPCIIFVQGSAWLEQDLFQQLPQVAKLGERGYVIAIVEYRHSGIAPFPAPIVDARNAVRFMRVHADQYGVDPNRMILAGDSSGGHTAMYGGIFHDDQETTNHFPGISAEVSGIINLYGSVNVMMEDGYPTNPRAGYADGEDGKEMGGIDLHERPDLKKLLTVEENISDQTNIAPCLIFHGTKDRIVNTKQSVSLYRKLKNCGKEAALYLVENADHGGGEFWTEQTTDIMDRFIRSCLE